MNREIIAVETPTKRYSKATHGNPNGFWKAEIVDILIGTQDHCDKNGQLHRKFIYAVGVRLSLFEGRVTEIFLGQGVQITYKDVV